MLQKRLALLTVVLGLALLVLGCNGGEDLTTDGVIVSTVEPSALGAVVEPARVPEGGKPEEAPTQAPGTQPTSVPATAGRPTSGRWIDVDVTRYRVQLMDSERVMQTIEPVAVGAQVNTGVYESTQTGLFRVYVKTEPLAYDAPYKTYISHWIGYDIERANGFHSFLKDASGKVVDASTGRISNGCVRTGAAEVIFAFAEIGMPVFIHF